MPLLTRNQLLLAKVETTKGTDASPAAATDAILSDLVDVSFDIQKIQAPEIRRSISEAPERPGRKKANFTIRVALKGSGTAGVPPEMSPLLQCCALKETTVTSVVGSEEVNYQPVSTEADMKTATVYLYYDGRLVKAVGCTGNFNLSTPPGEIGIVTFNLQGSLTSNVDASMPSGEVFQKVVAPVVESGKFKFGAFDAAIVNNFVLESGNYIVDRPDINSSGGLHSSIVAGRNPTWNTAIEATKESVKTWWGNFTNRVQEAISLEIGSTSGNKVNIALPKALLNDGITPIDNNGIVSFNLSGQALEDTGDDNYTLTFK